MGNSRVEAFNMDKRDCDTIGPVQPNMCQFEVDDLLVSVLLKNKRTSRSASTKTGPSHSRDKNLSTLGSSTVLAWLIHSGVISPGETIQLWSKEENVVSKKGLITKDGIECNCCRQLLSISSFKKHVGLDIESSGMKLVMESGKPLLLCQLEAWSAEYKARKVAPLETEEVEKGDDNCGICGASGIFIWCDNCPATYHRACLVEKNIKGDWCCLQCRCRTCWKVVIDKDPSGTFKCSMCKHKYHKTCMEGISVNMGLGSDHWFCEKRCFEIYAGLSRRIGRMSRLTDDISWTLLKCMDGDLRAHSLQKFLVLKAECNSKLAVALKLMEKDFLPMLDMKTKIDCIPQAVYNWGSPLNRLNYEGFYTAVVEKDDVIVCVASIRIHDARAAELPFIATCEKHRHQGIARHLLNAIEQMLKSSKIEKIFLPAAGPESADMWINRFGFQHLDKDERRSTRIMNLMVLPGSTWLVKSL